MKKIFLLLGLSVGLFSCNNHDSNNVRVSQPNVVVNPTTAAVGDNLDLQALGQLVQTSASAQEIETKLNTDGSINNLDLNGDGMVDYIRVSEFGEGTNRGFSFTVDMPDGTTSEVATIDIEQNNGSANMNIHGNRDYYGDHGYYHSSHDMSDLIIMSYLLSSHRPYYSPYHYGNYPSSYRSYRSVPTTTYRTKTVTRTIKSTPSRSTATTNTRPATTKATTPATSRTSALSKPTRSQKSFTTTSPAKAKPVVTGFGTRKTTPTSTSTRRSTSSSWGSSNSSTRRSSGSSWGSSSSSSRSSGSSWGSSSRRSSGFGSSSRSSRRSRF